MVRFLLILGIVGVLGYFGYTIVEMQRAPKPTSPVGAAKIFIQAALENNRDGMERICEPGVSAKSAFVAGELRNLIRVDTVLTWQNTRASVGQRALSAPISGSGRVLVVEVNQHGDEFRIAVVSLPSM